MTVAGLSLIVTNARILTGDPVRPWATALGISEGRLAVVGSAAEILKMVGTATKIVDAHGQRLTLPDGTTVGSEMAVAVAADQSVTLNVGQG